MSQQNEKFFRVFFGNGSVDLVADKIVNADGVISLLGADNQIIATFSAAQIVGVFLQSSEQQRK